MLFKLNDNVFFDPNKSELMRCSDGKIINKISLNTPTSKCLHILILKRNVVTQREFYNYVWGEHGIETTQNTLYQNISLLRKKLSTIFEDDHDYIITVPRKGFCLSSEIIEVTEVPEIINHSSPEISSAIFTQNLTKGIFRTSWFGIINILILSCSLSYVFYIGFKHYNNSNYDYFKNYELIADFDGCQFFSSPNFKDKKKRGEIIHKIQWLCIRGNYNYIVANDLTSPYTIFSCPEIAASSEYPQCSTIYFNDMEAE